MDIIGGEPPARGGYVDRRAIGTRTKRETPRRVVARVQRLCCLGLGSQAIMPALLTEIDALAPAFSRVFNWAGPQGELAHVYTDTPAAPSVLPVYFDEFHLRKERQVTLTFADTMRTQYPTAVADFRERGLTVGWAEFLKSDIYNLIRRPLGSHHRLEIKLSERGAGLGALVINRTEKEPEFSPQERRLLEAVAPFMAHAMTATPPLDAPLADSDDSGLIIATTDGGIQHLSAAARRLLLMATFAQWSPATLWGDTPGLPAPLVRLCRDLARAFEDLTPGSPPVWFHRNAWGGFEFRAYLLDPNAATPSRSLVGITIRRHEPLPLRVFRRAEALPLSAREINYVLLSAGGHGRKAIAERMGVSAHTAQTHGRNVYAKLGVHSRAELVERLRAV